VKRYAGVLTPITTPFTGEDEVDAGALRRNVARWVATPLHGIVVLGSNGEAPQLEDDEADRVIGVVRESVPASKWLLAGTGRESTKATIAATRRAAALGADAALVRTPSFFKPQLTSAVFVRHYTEVADASPIPILLYNVTMFTGVSLPVDAVETLATHPNIVGMKESGSDIGQIAELVVRTPDDFTVLGGSATMLLFSLSAGCDGAIVALAMLVPELCVELWTLVREGKFQEAHALQRRLMPLARSIGGQHGVPGVKAALDAIGYEGGYPRPPLRPVSPAVAQAIRAQVEAL
jgi:4-hydroxy-2-oxoglutarate aldolase